MKNGVLLLNMGGPNNLDEVKVFLKNMFNDVNILDIKNPLIRRFVAYMIVKNRQEESKGIYREIGGKSPMVDITKDLVKVLQNRLDESFDDTNVYFSMRYTPPFAKDVLKQMKDDGVSTIYAIALYPQYSTTTTKSSLEELVNINKKYSFDIKSIDKFYYNVDYNKAIIDRIVEVLDGDSADEFDIIFSAHGLPQKVVDGGDPYQKEVVTNVDILKKMLVEEGLNFKNIHVAYQSKVGPLKWLEPSLEDKLEEIESKKVIIFPIAFIIDNSETIFELHIEYKEVADKLKFEDYRVAKCVNDNPTFVKALTDIYKDMRY